MKLAKRIKKLRSEKGITQQQLADKIGVSRATVAGYESRGKEPPYDTLQKIANYFNVSTDYLLGNTEEKSPADKIKKALTDDPELSDAWEKISQREDLQLLFKQTKDMDKSSIRQVIRIIKAIEDEESNNS